MASVVTEVVGDLIDKSGKQVRAEDALKGKTVGLYFSGHWCGPCRMLTPLLVNLYNKQNATKKTFEIVFVSSDRSQPEFDEYLGEMPWLAIAYSEKQAIAKLKQKFKVTGIPCLVLYDDKGELLSKDAAQSLFGDNEGEGFPWKTPTLRDALGDKFVNANGDTFTFKDKLEGKYIALYFSAHWCGPCRAFTPRLIETYKKLVAEGKPFELVFVSSDRSPEQFKEYVHDMPWIALPFEDRKSKAALSQLFNVECIPSLFILDSNLKVINDDGRSAIAEDPEGKEFPWPTAKVSSIGRVMSKINDVPTAVVFTDDPEKVKADLEKAVDNFDLGEIVVAYADNEGDIAPDLRHFLGVAKHKEDPLVVLIDVMGQEKHISKEFSVEGFRGFLEQFKAGKLKGEPLR